VHVNGAALSAIGGMFPAPYLPTDSAAFWFMMLTGFAATYPVNWRLIRRGIKDIM
jgi:Domain of unknown function (DUF4396)